MIRVENEYCILFIDALYFCAQTKNMDVFILFEW